MHAVHLKEFCAIKQLLLSNVPTQKAVRFIIGGGFWKNTCEIACSLFHNFKCYRTGKIVIPTELQSQFLTV